MKSSLGIASLNQVNRNLYLVNNQFFRYLQIRNFAQANLALFPKYGLGLFL